MKSQWYPHPDNEDPRMSQYGRSVWCLIEIRKNATGEVRLVPSSLIIEHGESFPCTYLWEEGNYACDCNRELFFERAGSDEHIDVLTYPCGESRFNIRITNPADGSVIYSEFEEG